jgi:hypothetical protein
MGVVSRFRFFLQNNLRLWPRNPALLDGGRIGPPVKNEKMMKRHIYEYQKHPWRRIINSVETNRGADKKAK